METRMVFALGLPISDQGKNIKKQFFKVELVGRAGAVLEEYKNKTKSKEIFHKLMNEADRHKDIILGSYFDSYNLTAKSITSWRWISQFCPKAKTVLLINDDMVVDFDEISKFLKELSENDRLNIAAGSVREKADVFRPTENPAQNELAIHQADYPWNIFPLHLGGVASFFGGETVKKMAV